MIKHVIRIGPPLLRIPLLCLVWPPHFVLYIMHAALPARWGGHPNPERLLCLGFYAIPVALFWAAWDGLFVPSVTPEPRRASQNSESPPPPN